MSSVKVSGNASGTGIFTIQSPNSNSNYTFTLPTETGTVLTNTGPYTASSSATAGAVTIDASNNVGIGTSSPVSRLNVSVTDGGSVTISNTNDTHTGALNFGDTSSNTSGRISYDHSSNALRFDSNGSERARIDSSGNLLVGCTATVSASVKGVQLATGSANGRISIASNTTGGSDMMYFYNPNGIVGAVGTTGSSTYYNTSSDYRLKEDVQPMVGALDKIAALKPCTYKWKADGSAGEGFIAHELQAVVPGCVIGEKDAVDVDGNPVYQGIDTSFLVATLTAAIQELSAKVDAQAAEIAALKGAQA